MLIIDKTVVASDVTKESFVCDLNKCKGACCVEGDLGAPVEEDELEKLDAVVELVKPYLSKEAIEVLDIQGAYTLDDEGDFSTTTINNKECAFAYYDEAKILKCSIEQAWKDGKTDFQKPVSCHLYPIRIKQLGDYEAINYDRWDICSAACDLGAKLKVPVHRFLKDALTRKYGEAWFQKLEDLLEESEKETS